MLRFHARADAGPPAFWRRTLRPIAAALAAIVLVVGAGATFIGQDARDPRLRTVYAQPVGDLSGFTLEEFEEMIAAGEPLFARLRREKPEQFRAYVQIIRDFIVANVGPTVTAPELMELAFNLSGQLVAQKASTASDELVEAFADINVEFLVRTFEYDVESCLSPIRTNLVMQRVFADDPEFAYQLMSVNIDLLTDDSTTQRPVMAETELVTLLTGPFMETVVDRSIAMIRRFRPAESQEADIEAIRNAYLLGLPLPPDKLWIDCVVGAAFLESLDQIQDRDQRLAALRLFISYADDLL